ncbi:MAG: ATP-binding protein [Chloroflexota bacterium]
MNRMWIQLSAIYATILFIIAMIIITVTLVFPPDLDTVINRRNLSDANQEALLQLIEDNAIETIIRTAVFPPTIGFALIALVAGLIASVCASWFITQPLISLDTAIRKVATQDFDNPVAVRGSYEVSNLATSFNQMLLALQNAETRRQNLLADVSHELRTPLTVLQGNLRGALDDVYTLDKSQIAVLYNQIRQLNHLIDDLHDIAQAEANRLQLTMMGLELSALVEQVAELFAPLASDSGITIQTEVDAILPLFRGDKKRLLQVLQNLVGNALRYAKSQITLNLHHDKTHITLTVTDDGVGIPDSELPHIFDRFYRVDSSRTRATGGTGLGLAIVQSIVQAHGGTITVESQVNQGTSFIIRLPIIPTYLRD